jgi:hypothetical protein
MSTDGQKIQTTSHHLAEMLDAEHLARKRGPMGGHDRGQAVIEEPPLSLAAGT